MGETDERRAVIYARISLDVEGRGAGVERQIEACSALAAQHGWTVVEIITENNVSATHGQRPGFARLLELVRTGLADTVTYWHQDRLSRGVRDLAALLDLRSVCPTLALVPVQGTPIYAADPSGRMTAEILAAVAGHESARTGERVRAKQWQAKQQGTLPPRTYGYIPDAQPHPVQAPAVRAAFAAFLATESLAAAQRALLAADPSAPASRTAVRAMLTRPTYAAIASWQGVERPDLPTSWPALITPDDLHRTAALLARPARRYAQHDRRERHSLGTGTYLCGRCGEPLHQTRRDGQRTYVCRAGGSHLYRLADPVDRFALGLILARLGMADAQRTILPRRPDPEALDLHAQIRQTDRALQAMTDDLAAGLLPRPQALATISRLMADREALETRLAALPTPLGPEGTPQPHDPLRAVMAAPLADLRTALHTLATLTLHPVAGSPKGTPRSAPRPFLPASVTVDWRTDTPAPLSDSLESKPLDLASIGISPDAAPPSITEWVEARRLARRHAVPLTESQRRALWTALAQHASD